MTPAASPPVVAKAISDLVSQALPAASGFERMWVPTSTGDRSVPDQDLPVQDENPPRPTQAETVGASASLPAGVATVPATIDITQSVPSFDEGLPGEVVDAIDLGALERRRAWEDAEADGEGDTRLVHYVVPYAVASVAGLAWGNLVFTSQFADRKGRREPESPESATGPAILGWRSRWSRRLGLGRKLVEANN